MDFSVITHANASELVRHRKALIQGLQAHGLAVTETHPGSKVRTERVACWGWRRGKELRAGGHSVLVMERGYIGDRFAWTSLGWNGLNGRASVAEVPDDGGERFNAHHAGILKPWNPDGSYILIMGQVPGDASLQGLDLTSWYADQARWAASASGLPIKFRPHPLARRRGGPASVPGTTSLIGDLDMALAGARLVITYNSNSGVDALLAGKPVTVADEGSMALGVDESNREAWAYRLAWRQWSLDEIASGYALEHVGLTDG